MTEYFIFQICLINSIQYYYILVKMSSLDCACHHHSLSQGGVLPISDHHPGLWQTRDIRDGAKIILTPSLNEEINNEGRFR